LLNLPDFPEDAEDASDLLFIARSIKEQKRNLMLAEKCAIREDNIFLGFCRRVPEFVFTEEDEEEIRQWSTEALEVLEQAKQEILIAEQDVEFVCDLLRKKGLPIDDKRPLLPSSGDGDKAEDSCESVASDFDMDDSDEGLNRTMESLEL
jgi:predicted RNase H-like HicB family nuclease